ncbi:transglycosylase domain-containing protein [Prosthecomicrobium sp. N25]|uniref:transglycosylase domain-containing protein n=1 Tax=Prosthecomicrobium sp. N25 TaxID=3129254 RepID=UPI0030789F87
MEVDAWIDSSIYRFTQGLGESYIAFNTFMRRFTVTGWKRGLVEILDDGMTFGAAGTVLLVAFALPAFEATKKDWRKEVDYSVTFLDRNGVEIGRRGILLNDTVPLDDIPDHLIKATLATEDRRFFDHFGIDFFGTARALVENIRHKGVTQGGSSLTQQLAKNLFLTNERSLERKIKEAYLAFWLEANLTKREILKLYLDRAYMGGGTFGVAAASEFYFGKSVRDINLAEAAMLSGLYKAPTKYAPHVNLPNARARANEVLTNMVQAGFLTEGQVLAARRNPAKAVDRRRDYTPDYFLDYAFDEVQALSPADHTIVVKSTIDIGIQKKAEEVTENTLRQFGQELDIGQSATVVMEPDGAVRGIVGGRDYGASQFNRAVRAKRQPGSSFKPYVYATALLAGRNPNSRVVDQPTCIGDWCPKNYSGGFSGAMTLTTALAKSINSIPVQLARDIGRDRVVATTRRFGITLPDKPDWPFVLGAMELTVLDQAAGYAAFANGGRRVHPYAIDQILTTSGTVIWDHKTQVKPPEQIMPVDKAMEMNQMMLQVVENGTARRAILEGIPAAGKTGTTQSYRDAWFIGYTGNYVTAVWVGNDDYRPMEKVTGGLIPAQMWKDIMAFAHQNVELKQMPGAPPPVRKGSEPAAVAGAKPGAPGQAGQPGKPGLTEVAGGQPAERPRQLSVRTIGVLTDIESLMKSAPPVGRQGGLAPVGRQGALEPGKAPAAPARDGGLQPVGGASGSVTPVGGPAGRLAAVN